MSIIYTLTDESPRLATFSLLPIIEAYAGAAGVEVTSSDISLASRILAKFPEYLAPEQQVPDALAELGEKTFDPRVNLIKLPNISASLPQMHAAIKELQAQGYKLPEYPHNPTTDEERDIAARYDSIKGSAVNPVLRQGNSDRRAPASVKSYARRHPHRNKPWEPATGEGDTAVATMSHGDFFHNEATLLVEAADELKIRFVPADGGPTQVWRTGIKVNRGDVFDASFMSAAQLDEFLAETVERAKAENLLYSVHLKATMMKISDPIIFGHAVRALLPGVFANYGKEMAAAGILPDNGLKAIELNVDKLKNGTQIHQAIADELATGPRLAMVDSDNGITALHVPNDVIIDASMPAMIRNGGKMWGPDGGEHNALAVIPDSSYAGVYQAVIEDCRTHGAINPATAGSVSNIGLMAQAAEEYGSHDKTFLIPAAGRVEVVSAAGEVFISQEVAPGDIWRACLTKRNPIENWVKLAVERGRRTGEPVVFWLDLGRPHDAVLATIVEDTLSRVDASRVDIHIMAPAEATHYSLDRLRAGLNTISATGNVLRDYLTDLFPILEVGTSAKMLSIVPLMAGGGMFETGAGGSAPKHVGQLVKENHLRWDSLGEFLALAASFEHLARVENNPKAQVLAETLDVATARLLEENRTPGRGAGDLDTRGAHFYLAWYWADELARQTKDKALAAKFQPLADRLTADAPKILEEFVAASGKTVDIGGYYQPDVELTSAIMRPSATFNKDLALLGLDR